MKKTTTINLKQLIFHIDEDAYYALKDYLEEIQRHISGADKTATDEIMDDVEARIAELFSAYLNTFKHVINLEDVNKVISQLGSPADFGEGQPAGAWKEPASNHRSHKAYRRMYRDPEDRVLGGVCSGLGAYFSVDPLIVRILFIVAFFGMGFGLLIYLLLWIVLPAAFTTAQRLEMHGKPVNINNISQTVREEFYRIKENFKRKY